jgi:hypothetical protein
MNSDFELLRAAVISNSTVVQTEIVVLRQFITALLDVRGRLESADVFMARLGKESIIHELRVMATALKVPVRSQGDLEVKRLFARLKEGRA